MLPVPVGAAASGVVGPGGRHGRTSLLGAQCLVSGVALLESLVLAKWDSQWTTMSSRRQGPGLHGWGPPILVTGRSPNFVSCMRKGLQHPLEPPVDGTPPSYHNLELTAGKRSLAHPFTSCHARE